MADVLYDFRHTFADFCSTIHDGFRIPWSWFTFVQNHYILLVLWLKYLSPRRKTLSYVNKRVWFATLCINTLGSYTINYISFACMFIWPIFCKIYLQIQREMNNCNRSIPTKLYYPKVWFIHKPLTQQTGPHCACCVNVMFSTDANDSSLFSAAEEHLNGANKQVMNADSLCHCL